MSNVEDLNTSASYRLQFLEDRVSSLEKRLNEIDKRVEDIDSVVESRLQQVKSRNRVIEIIECLHKADAIWRDSDTRRILLCVYKFINIIVTRFCRKNKIFVEGTDTSCSDVNVDTNAREDIDLDTYDASLSTNTQEECNVNMNTDRSRSTLADEYDDECFPENQDDAGPIIMSDEDTGLTGSGSICLNLDTGQSNIMSSKSRSIGLSKDSSNEIENDINSSSCRPTSTLDQSQMLTPLRLFDILFTQKTIDKINIFNEKFFTKIGLSTPQVNILWTVYDVFGVIIRQNVTSEDYMTTITKSEQSVQCLLRRIELTIKEDEDVRQALKVAVAVTHCRTRAGDDDLDPVTQCPINTSTPNLKRPTDALVSDP